MKQNPALGFSTIPRSDGFSDYSERLLADSPSGASLEAVGVLAGRSSGRRAGTYRVNAMPRNYGLQQAVDLLALSWGSLMTTMLVVEDEILVRLAICEDLAAEGYEVLTADDADQAIEILESRNDITTIFTDIEMPGLMNGLKLAAAVRDRWPPVNIVITTGKARPPNDQMPTNSRFVAKPYQKRDVLGALQSLGT
jgi:two-component system, response regulator PdtaR